MDIVTLGGSRETRAPGKPQPTAFRPQPKAIGTGRSIVVERCQVCDSPQLEPVLFLGYLPPVNAMQPIGARPIEQPSYPAQLLRCARCSLVQLGLIVDPAILFPPTYPYTSGTTRALRENFKELAHEVASLYPLGNDDLVVDIGSNDGTLLSNFAVRGPVLGIEPTDAGKLAITRGIPTYIAFFNSSTARRIASEEGRARLITATNVFAHIETIHDVIESILLMLHDNGVFVSESHYLLSLIETLQYDTIYHEHLRYYSLASLKHLLEMHGMEVIHARPIPTHGGSIRVYAARQGKHRPRETVQQMLTEEASKLTPDALKHFSRQATESKLRLLSLLNSIRAAGERIYGIGAPSRASTLVHFTGLDQTILDCVVEVEGSHKIGKYLPGTLIPVLEESKLFVDQPPYAMLLSWHIAEELMPRLRERGYRGKFIVPLPEPRIVE
jgi:hypothetical protein